MAFEKCFAWQGFAQKSYMYLVIKFSGIGLKDASSMSFHAWATQYNLHIKYQRLGDTLEEKSTWGVRPEGIFKQLAALDTHRCTCYHQMLFNWVDVWHPELVIDILWLNILLPFINMHARVFPLMCPRSACVHDVVSAVKQQRLLYS